MPACLPALPHPSGWPELQSIRKPKDFQGFCVGLVTRTHKTSKKPKVFMIFWSRCVHSWTQQPPSRPASGMLNSPQNGPQRTPNESKALVSSARDAKFCVSSRRAPYFLAGRLFLVDQISTRPETDEVATMRFVETKHSLLRASWPEKKKAAVSSAQNTKFCVSSARAPYFLAGRLFLAGRILTRPEKDEVATMRFVETKHSLLQASQPEQKKRPSRRRRT